MQAKDADANVDTADEYFEFCDKFKLGNLVTQHPNPKTAGLSQMAQNDIVKAINCIKELDIETV